MIYLDILKFSFLRFFAYPYEIMGEISKKFIVMLFVIFFWSVVIKSTNNSMDLTGIVSYFLLATGIKELVGADYGELGSLLGKHLIQSGQISNYLMKPYNTILAIYAVSLGRSGMGTIMALVIVFLGIIIHPPSSFLSVVLFLAFFINAWLVAFAINLFTGTIYFYTPDASGFRNVINHIIQVFSGVMVPLYLFPEQWLKTIKLTPFPTMVFGPVNALSTSSLSSGVILDLGVGIFWSISLNLFAFYFFRQAVKKYEAIGV